MAYRTSFRTARATQDKLCLTKTKLKVKISKKKNVEFIKTIKYLHKSQESIQNIDSQNKRFSARSKKVS